MFKFMDTHKLHILHSFFMRSEQEIDINHEITRRILSDSDEYRRRHRKESPGENIEQKFSEGQIEDKEYEEWLRKRNSYTIAEIGQGTGLEHEEIRQTMKAAENDFVHWPHPEHPDMHRFALRQHAEHFAMQQWQPGTGFSEQA